MIKDDLRSLCPAKSRGPGRVDVDKYSCTVKMDNKEDAEFVFCTPLQAVNGDGGDSERSELISQTDQLITRGLPRLPGTGLLVHYMQTFENGRTRTILCNGANTVCRNGNHVAGNEEQFGAVQELLSQSYGWTDQSTTTSSGVVPGYSIAPTAAATTYTSAAAPSYGPSSDVSALTGWYWQQEVAVRTMYTAMSPTTYPAMQLPGAGTAQSGYLISPSTLLPVNTSSGTVQTESRGIFIRNLSYKTTDSELKKLLKQFGKPLRCELHRDKDNKPTGSATALFASATEARIVEGRLNGHKHRGHKLSVRSDRETTSVVEEAQQPSLLIANGSTADAGSS